MAAQTAAKIHAGRVLLEEFLAQRDISVSHFAKDIGVPQLRTRSGIRSQPI